MREPPFFTPTAHARYSNERRGLLAASLVLFEFNFKSRRFFNKNYNLITKLAEINDKLAHF